MIEFVHDMVPVPVYLDKKNTKPRTSCNIEDRTCHNKYQYIFFKTINHSQGIVCYLCDRHYRVFLPYLILQGFKPLNKERNEENI